MILHIFTHYKTDAEGNPELVTADETTIDASINSGQLDASRVNETPDREGYQGYLLGDGIPPNGEEFGFGASFPLTQTKGDYFLRTDFMPNRLFRYDGQRWVKMEDGVRMTLTNTDNRNTYKTDFINNTKQTTIGGEVVKERQSLKDALKPKADN